MPKAIKLGLTEKIEFIPKQEEKAIKV